jgi:hypothetical protein
MKHVAWDYEEDATPPYYHVYAVSDAGEFMMDGDTLEITAPETPDYSADIQIIVDALDRIGDRLNDQGY